LPERRLHIVTLFLLLLTAWFSSCKPKYVCPAYQSAFYLDQKAAAILFTPFDKDTMPKLERLVRKSDVLLIVRLGKKKIENRMSVIPMITIYPEQDSALAAIDSLGGDSLNTDEIVADDEIVSDSSETSGEEGDEKINEDENPDGDQEENPDDEQEPLEEDKPSGKKAVRKKDDKDPEISDPGLKFEFEETFEDSASSTEYQEFAPEEENDIPVPREDEKRKAIPDGDADKPKEEEEEGTEDDKF
jgi:hypothetical protein